MLTSQELLLLTKVLYTQYWKTKVVEVLKVHYSYEPQGSCLGASCLRPRLTQLCFFFFIFHIHFLSLSHFSTKSTNRICVMNCFSQHVFGLFLSIYCFYTVYNFLFLCFLLCFIVAFFPLVTLNGCTITLLVIWLESDIYCWLVLFTSCYTLLTLYQIITI